MAEYNALDLQSTLNYIKKRFGMDVFAIPGRILGLFSDLAPSLNEDRVMLERMSKRGILEGFVNANGLSESEKNIFIAKMLMILTDSEFIRPEVAVRYVSTFVNVFEWKIEVSLPRERTKEVFQFDSQRYLNEIKDEIYQQADHAFTNEDYLSALALFNKANELGNIQAGVRLGQMYWNGDGCEVDYEKAVRLFVVGTSGGNPLANEWLVDAYQFGRGVPKDDEKAEMLSRFGQKALGEMCALKDPDAMYMQGWNYLNSPYYSKNEMLGYSFLRSAAERGHIKAKIQTALCLLEGNGCIKDVKNGLNILEELANTSKNSSVYYALGKQYYFGKTVERNYEKARIYFEFAANKNNKFAPRYLGDIYFRGEGVKVDYVEARNWYLKAFSYGDINAARQLGFIYYYGEGLNKDSEESFKYFKYAADKGETRSQYMLHYFFFFMEQFENYQVGCEYLIKAAEAGDDLAQILLAKMYFCGEYGLNESVERAIYWLQKAAVQENAEAEYFLGSMYAFSPDVLPTDYEKAVYWLKKAAEQNYIEALIELAELYYEGKCVEKNEQIVLSYAKKAEKKLREKEIRQPDLWFKLAECYEKLKDTKKATDCFWKAFHDGKMEALENVVWYTLIQKQDSSERIMSDQELLNFIEREAESSENAYLSFLVGIFYYLEENQHLAEYWLNISSEKGYVPATEYLASFYGTIWLNYTRGFEMAEKAFNLGSAEGARLLGMCYKLGHGTKKNKRKAKEILKIAVERGSEEAAKELKKFVF